MSSYTVINYANYLEHFLTYIGDIPPSAVKMKNIDEYMGWLSSNNYSVSTINYHLTAIRSLAKFADLYDYPFLQPKKILLPKYRAKPAEFLTSEEVHILLNRFDGDDIVDLRNRAFVEFIYSTGMRIGEALKLRKSDVNIHTKQFTIIGKGNRTRIVFLSDDAVLHLSNYLKKRFDDQDCLFASHGRRKQGGMTRASFELIIRKKAAEVFPGRKITPHTFRHSFATDLLHNGADIKAVQDLLGHSNIQTTQYYLHYTNLQLRHVYDLYHNAKKGQRRTAPQEYAHA